MCHGERVGPMSRRHLTVQQVATLLRCRTDTVRAWIHSGALPAVRVSDGYRISSDALQRRLSPVVSMGVKAPANPGHRRTSGNARTGYVEGTILEDLMLNDHLSLSDAASYVGRSTRTVRRWVEDGRLPNAKRVVQRLLIPVRDLDALVQPANPAFASVG